MTVTRTQGIERTLVDFPIAPSTITTFDLPRPETSPKDPAYAENTDHVTKVPAIREMEGGHCVVDFAATLLLPTVFLQKVEVRKLLPIAQKGLGYNGEGENPGALYPTGAPTDESLVRVLLDRGAVNDLPIDDDAVVDFFGNAKVAGAPRGYPGVTLRAGEFLRITLDNQSGGALAAQAITATYKLGLNQSDTGKP